MKRSIAVIAMSAVLLTSYSTTQGQVSAAAQPVQSVLKGHIKNSVNLRDKPSPSGNIVGLLKKGMDVTILERSSDYFYKVQSRDGVKGYVSASEKYISVGQAATIPNGGGQGPAGVVIYGVNLRDQPSTSGKVLGMLSKGTKITILERSNNYFYKIVTESGKTGYVSSSAKYLEISGNVTGPTPSPAPAPTPIPEQPSSIQAQVDLVIQAGKKYLGTPYEFGSSRNTTTTFDCSDFVRQAYRDAIGIVLPADSRKQGSWIRDNGTAVYDIGSLKAGDLVFFMDYKGSKASSYQGVNPNSERISHVSIYLGGGQMLHTYSASSGGVRIDKLDGSWEYRFLYGGSVLK